MGEGDGIKKEIEILDKKVCPDTEDPAGCKAGVETWWPYIAPIIFNTEAAKYVCAGLSEGACEAMR